MPKTVNIPGRPVLDLMSYARRGPGHADRLSPAEIQQIERTVTRTPEVMIKVLSRGDQNLRAVRRHFDYLSRGGELEIEADDGTPQGRGVEKRLLEDWDLDLDDHRRRSELTAANGRKPPKLVHKLMFSMPPGTPPDKVLAAVRDFAREAFALKHRYAMVLHTDEPHPHVHVVIKAVSEHGERLNIRKAMLRGWRQEFARHLRAYGVAANATERAVRGASSTRKPDGIYRAALRGASTHMHEKIEKAASYLAEGWLPVDAGKPRLIRTRRCVGHGWRAVARLLDSQGEQRLAESVYRFVGAMRPARTEREVMMGHLLERAKARAHDTEPTR